MNTRESCVNHLRSILPVRIRRRRQISLGKYSLYGKKLLLPVLRARCSRTGLSVTQGLYVHTFMVTFGMRGLCTEYSEKFGSLPMVNVYYDGRDARKRCNGTDGGQKLNGKRSIRKIVQITSSDHGDRNIISTDNDGTFRDFCRRESICNFFRDQ